MVWRISNDKLRLKKVVIAKTISVTLFLPMNVVKTRCRHVLTLSKVWTCILGSSDLARSTRECELLRTGGNKSGNVKGPDILQIKFVFVLRLGAKISKKRSSYGILFSNIPTGFCSK